jgi:hypothetical protein
MARLHVALSAFVLLIAACPAVAVDATTDARTADHSDEARIASCGRPIAPNMSRGEIGACRDLLQALALHPSNAHAQASPRPLHEVNPLFPKPPSGPRCRLDQIVFNDSKRGRQFVAERVAVDYAYLCGHLVTKRYSRPQEPPENCSGPYGDTIIEGKLDGAKAYAVYTDTKALPCCQWQTFFAHQKKPKVREWLGPDDVPVIHLDDRRYTISSAPGQPDRGPMRDGEFVPSVCRSR